jgi:hypothetical protein
MSKHIALTLSLATLSAACATGRTATAGGEIAPVTPLSADWLPPGTSVIARLDQSIGTISSRTGDSFSVTVLNPVFAQDGTVAIPAGSLLRGHITGIHTSTGPSDRSLIRLKFDDLQMHGVTYPVTASISNIVIERPVAPPPESSLARGPATAVAVGATTATIVNGADLSRILAAGLLGSATGTVIALGTSSPDTFLPGGSALTVRTNEAVRVR